MSAADFVLCAAGACVVLLIYRLGRFLGALAQRDLWQRHMERATDYRMAVDDLDRWCGHGSPHARLIARHIKAHGEGLPLNAGTPHADEACTINGLRDQLRRIDASIAEAAAKPAEPTLPTLPTQGDAK